MTPDKSGAQRFSTDMFTSRERVTAWREFIGRALFRLDIEPEDHGEFQAETVVRTLPGIGLLSSRTAPARFFRTPQMVQNDDLYLYIARTGAARYSAWRREAVIAPGEAVLVGAGEPGVQLSQGDYRLTGLRLPRLALAGAIPDLEDRLCQHIAASSAPLRLLTAYVDAAEADTTAPPANLQVMASHMRDLVVLALGASSDATAAAAARGGRAARLHAIKADIETSLHQPGLSTATLAARHRLNERALQRLFEAEGTSCTAYILERRLARVHRMLTDPRTAGLQIKTIVLDAGFAHLSRFTSAFRARFGATATQVRAQALPGRDRSA